MMSLRLLARNATPQLAASTQRLHTSKLLFESESSDSDTSDDEKRKKKVPEPKKVEAKEQSSHRINSLLTSMMEQSKTPSKVNVALHRKKPTPKAPKVHTSGSTAKHLFEDKLTGAAKDVAASLGGDTSKTESELLKKIITPKTTVQQPLKLGKLVRGMNVDHKKPNKINAPRHRADQVRTAMQKHEGSFSSQIRQGTGGKYESTYMNNNTRVDLDSGVPMNLFSKYNQAQPDPNTPKLATWDILEEKTLKMAVTHPPKNYIEQMILWTEQGRLWRFPIDNEQDLDIDQEEHFTDHVFLEHHLEDWCPTKGPIRHFMELVCVGLSKNPYLSAAEKREHIIWFKEYFASKHDLLSELGAYGTEKPAAGNKQIEP